MLAGRYSKVLTPLPYYIMVAVTSVVRTKSILDAYFAGQTITSKSPEKEGTIGNTEKREIIVFYY